MRGTLEFVASDGYNVRGSISGTGKNSPLLGIGAVDIPSLINYPTGTTFSVEYEDTPSGFLISNVYGVNTGSSDPRGEGITTTPIAIPYVGPTVNDIAPIFTSNLPTTTQSPGDPNANLLGTIGGALGGLLGGMGGIGGILGTLFGGGGPTGTGGGLVAGCPSGYREVGGKCVNILAGLPGGDPLVYTPSGGNGTAPSAWMPGSGAYSVQPQLKTVRTRVCPPGGILGKDGLCYPKGMLPKKWRMHPSSRPLLSAGDAKVLNRARSLERKLNNVAGRFLAPPKPTRRKKGRGRARK